VIVKHPWNVHITLRLGLVFAASASAAALIAFLSWNLWDAAHPPPSNDPAMARRQALARLDAELNYSNQWRTKLPDSSQFDHWLGGLRNEFRPYFNLLSARFDSHLLVVLHEFAAHSDDSGPLRAHSRQLAWVSVRSLLEEERRRLVRDEVRTSGEVIRLPLWMFNQEW
jgi:hypothetical protein